MSTENTGSGNPTLDAIMAQYEEATKKPEKKNTAKKVYDLKNYFTTFLEKGKDTDELHIRILPPTDEASSPFEGVHFHHVQVGGEWKKITCNAKNELGEGHSDRCPYCEANEALRLSGEEEDKELAKKFNARKFYVVKVIQRGKEDEGVKFWRFKHDYRNSGILDKIVPLLRHAGGNIFDPETGKDLIIVLGRDQNGYGQVTQIMLGGESKLSDDEAQANEWLSDERTWRDVYSIKRPDYLEILVRGEEPVWDTETKGFVSKESLEAAEAEATEINQSESEEMIGGPLDSTTTATATATATEVATTTDTSTEDEEDDLPF